MARKKWSKLSRAEKKAFRDGDRSIGKKEYKAQRQASRPVTVNKGASQKVKNIGTKLAAAQSAGRQKKSEKLAGKLQEARGNQLRKSDIRQMVKESGGNIQSVNKQLKQKNLRSGAQKFLSKKLSAATNKPPTKITKAVEPQRPQAPSLVIRGGVNNVKNDNNISLNTGTVPNEPPARPDTSAPVVGNQISSTSNQIVGYNGENEITNSTVMGGVGNVDNSNNSSFFQGSQAFQTPQTFESSLKQKVVQLQPLSLTLLKRIRHKKLITTVKTQLQTPSLVVVWVMSTTLIIQ